jgi:shikimate kinase
MDIRLKRSPGIYLVGFMACGKSTIGRLLAGELGWPFADLDDDVERAAGMEISRIFDERGEAEFRRLETEALARRVHDIAAGHPLVLALGGGAFAQPANLELVRDHGVSIFLDCPLEVVKSRVARASHRPLARDPRRLESLYFARRPLYEQADYRMEVDDRPPGVHVQRILELPVFR